jgi:hypothetical protein
MDVPGKGHMALFKAMSKARPELAIDLVEMSEEKSHGIWGLMETFERWQDGKKIGEQWGNIYTCKKGKTCEQRCRGYHTIYS